MRLYIWEGDRISDAYHNDGTLVVLAETPEQAREVARDVSAEDRARRWDDDAPARWYDRLEYGGEVDPTVDAAINREPDRIVDLDVPCVVAFNGGGYD